jgi:hypothetical protein
MITTYNILRQIYHEQRLRPRGIIPGIHPSLELLPSWVTDAPHQNTSRIKNTRIRISPRTLIINYSTTTYPNKIILNHRAESIEILNLYNLVFLSKAL